MSDGHTRDPEATRAAILEAAEAVFVQKGFADAAVSEIAELAGVTKSLIHHHFGSKEKLWGEVKHHRFEEYAAVQRRILEDFESDSDLLRRSVETYFRFLKKNPGFPRLISWMHLEEAERQPFDLGESLTEQGIARIREGQERGELRSDVHPFFMLVSFLGLCEHWFQSKEHHCQWCEEGSDLRSDDAYLQAMLKIYFEGVLPRDERAGEAA
jgi:TetR/AcrR family transcriptional regulator